VPPETEDAGVPETGERQLPKERVAILIPCYNEELTVARVIADFRCQLPDAVIYVFDNNSRDGTVERARAAGARVRHEPRQGKGFVVQSMFRTVDADVYVMVDGDGTYAAEAVHRLMVPVRSGEADMVVGSRLHPESRSRFRELNRLGNRLFLAAVNALFGVCLTDTLSGYRVFSRGFVKGIPLFGGGFEIETELTIKAIERGYRIVELPIDLGERPVGSFSKIQVRRDGMLILNTILSLFRDYKPLTFFGIAGVTLLAVAVALGLAAGTSPGFWWVVSTASTGLGGMLSIVIGLVLHTITRRSQELEYSLRVMTEELGARRAEQ
jgi:glycosyltransferase involved in cell wall biosynthesis